MRGIANIIAIIFLWFVLVSGTLLVATPLLLLYLLGVFAGAKGRAEGLKTKLRSAMMQGEEVVVEAIEYRPYGLFHRRIGIAVTTSRVIQIRRKILGGFRMRDQQWKDLKDVRIDENSFPEVFGSSLIFEFEPELEARNIEVHGINPKLASAIYGYAQAQEHAWEEKRRVRGLEDKRAMAGGINFHAGQPFGGFAAPEPHPSYGRDRLIEATAMPVGAMDNSSTDPLAKELSRAKSLLDQGAITDAEFQEIKAKILSKYF